MGIVDRVRTQRFKARSSNPVGPIRTPGRPSEEAYARYHLPQDASYQLIIRAEAVFKGVRSNWE